MRLLSVGEVLWDVFAERESLGGAALNVCAHLRRCGDEAVLVSAVGDDVRGSAALEAMKALGLSTQFVQRVDERPTGTAFVNKDVKGEPVFTIQRPAAFDSIELSEEVMADINRFGPDWLYMGTLLQTEPAMETLVHALLEDLTGIRCFYDMNLRPGHWNFSLVERLCSLASVLKLNEVEAKILAVHSGIAPEEFSLEFFCALWAHRFGIDVICVTLGPEGCCIYSEGKAEWFGGHPVEVSDTVGAGDAFAAAFLHAYHRNWPMVECANFANALGALVASRPGATPLWQMEECRALSGPTGNVC